MTNDLAITTSDISILIDRGEIIRVEPRDGKSSHQARQTLEAALVAPGLIDLHVHGGGGADVADGTPDALELVCQVHARHGTTGLCPTVLASSPDRTLKALEVIREASQQEPGRGARVLGAHLEGPFLNPKKAGAQPTEHLLAPDLKLLEELLDAARGTLKIVTLAPELPGALELIERLVEAEVVVSMGHSAATFDQALAAIDVGCTLATHTFNAMSGLHHREPGLVGAVLDDDRVTAEAIADGHHLSAPILRLLRRVKGAKLALITDCIAALEAEAGQARLGDQPVHVEGGAARLQDGTLAGSVLTMERAVSNLVHLGGASWDEALAAGSANPASVLRRADIGRLEAGQRADLLLFDREMELRRVVINGQVLPDVAQKGNTP